jgi:tRNA(Ile)-lysidine synthase
MNKYSVLLHAKYVLKSFLNHIESELTELKGSKSLLAVSGGRDSMVLWHLFESLKLPYAVAHCNFGLRGEESDAETALVEEKARLNNDILFVERFGSLDFKKGESTQENARNLRYAFFEKLKQSHGFDRVVTAHHFMDQWEHLFIYLYRNNSATALRGMPSSISGTYRPMLKLSSHEIEEYANSHSISYLNDSSNSETKYLRNKIRHWIIPDLEKNLLQSLEDVNANQAKIDQKLHKEFKKTCAFWNEKYWGIPLSKVTENPYLKAEIQKSGIHHSLVGKVLKLSSSGSQIETPSGVFSLSQEMLVFSKPLLAEDAKTIAQADLPLVITFGLYEIVLNLDDMETFENSKMYFDAEKIEWPIKITNSNKGDRIDLFGNGRSQKISDVFINAKIPFFIRATVPLIAHDRKILCAANLKRSNHLLVNNDTKKILQVSFKPIGLLEKLVQNRSKNKTS